MTEIERLEKEIELLKLDLRQARLETEHLRHDLQKSLGYDINIYKTEYINCRFNENNFLALKALLKRITRDYDKII
jgi:hypothetical protein